MKRIALIALLATAVSARAEEVAEAQSQKAETPPSEITVPVKGGTMKIGKAEHPSLPRHLSAGSEFDAEQMKKEFLEIRNLTEILKNKLKNFKKNYGMSIDVQLDDGDDSVMPSRRTATRVMDKKPQTSPETGKDPVTPAQQ